MKVIVSLTTLPSRIWFLQETINSLISQTYSPDMIYLWVPKRIKRTGQVFNEIPQYSDKITIKRCTDLGPLTKIGHTLNIEKDKETAIVVCDDDVIYPANWLEKLVSFSNLKPLAVLGYRGKIFKNNNRDYLSMIGIENPSRPMNVDIITATWGVLFRRGFLQESFLSFKECPSGFWNDDIWLSGHMARRGIERIIIPGSNIKPRLSISNKDSLWSINKRASYNNEIINYFGKDWK